MKSTTHKFSSLKLLIAVTPSIIFFLAGVAILFMFRDMNSDSEAKLFLVTIEIILAILWLPGFFLATKYYSENNFLELQLDTESQIRTLGKATELTIRKKDIKRITVYQGDSWQRTYSSFKYSRLELKSKQWIIITSMLIEPKKLCDHLGIKPTIKTFFLPVIFK